MKECIANLASEFLQAKKRGYASSIGDFTYAISHDSDAVDVLAQWVRFRSVKCMDCDPVSCLGKPTGVT
jgi:hypothetical protein